jgi:membrane fusion protein (multidrug efflux system)
VSETPSNPVVTAANPPAAPNNKNGNGVKPLAKRKRFLVTVSLLVAGSIAVATWYWIQGRLYQSTDDAFIEAHIVQISPKVAGQVIKVAVNDNEMVQQGQLLIEIDPRDYEARVAQAKGALEAAQARLAGAEVNVGLTGTTSSTDVDMATAGVTTAESAVEAAKANVATAKSRLEQAKGTIATAKAASEQMKADVVASQAEATRTSDDLKRYEQLIQSGSVTKQQYDAAVTAATSAKAKLESAAKHVDVGRAQVDEADAAQVTAVATVKASEAMLAQALPGVAQAQAKLAQVNVTTQKVALSQSQRDSAASDIQQLKGMLEQAQLQLSYTKILAPTAGNITKKSIESGAYVVPGQPLLAIVEPNVWVLANFKETQLTHMRPGQPVTIKIDAYPGVSLAGHVDSVQSGTGARFSLLPPENATGNYVKIVQRVPVKIVFDQPPDKQYTLAPGMSVVPEVRVR